MGVDPAFLRYDLDYLAPPEPSEEGDAERAEDREWDEGDRAFDERRDREFEEREVPADG